MTTFEEQTGMAWVQAMEALCARVERWFRAYLHGQLKASIRISHKYNNHYTYNPMDGHSGNILRIGLLWTRNHYV